MASFNKLLSNALKVGRTADRLQGNVPLIPGSLAPSLAFFKKEGGLRQGRVLSVNIR